MLFGLPNCMMSSGTSADCYTGATRQACLERQADQRGGIIAGVIRGTRRVWCVSLLLRAGLVSQGSTTAVHSIVTPTGRFASHRMFGRRERAAIGHRWDRHRPGQHEQPADGCVKAAPSGPRAHGV